MRDLYEPSTYDIVPAFRSATTRVKDVAQRTRQAREATLVIACPAAEGGRWIGEFQDAFAVCGVAERMALEQATVNLKPEILVVDLALTGLRRARGLRDIHLLSPETKIVVLTDTPTEREGIFALKAGARAYCARTIEPASLKKAVIAVQHGEIWAPRNLVPGLVAELVSLIDSREKDGNQPKPACCLASLTERQRLVADLISRGASNKEIGSRLNITERTVKAHLTEAFRNVGVSGRLELALLLQRQSRASGD